MGVVGSSKKGTPVPIEIEDIPFGFGIPVTISRSTLKNQDLHAGSRIVVRLSRGSNRKKDFGLQAHFISHADDHRPFQLIGQFNQQSGKFSPLDRSIKTAFRLAHGDTTDTSNPRRFLACLPARIDITDPVVFISNEQDQSTITDEEINHIVTQKHDIATVYPEDVLKEAEFLSQKPIDFNGRVDLRDLDFVTVDPPGSTDLDDAFYAEKTDQGYDLYTAIADVPALVTYNSAVDRKAYQRGITFYMGEKRTLHMLPPVLSTQKCSLLQHEDRPAIVVRQSLDHEGNLLEAKVMAGVIQSHSRLTYEQFYALLNRKDDRFKAVAEICAMNGKRESTPLGENPESFRGASIIETLMVQTNSLISKFLKAAGIPFLSRNMESPSPIDQKRAYYAPIHSGHAALGLLHYAHTTSPIRRYVDIVNMRAVHKMLGTPGIGISDEEILHLNETARHLNGRRTVEREVAHDLGKHHFLRALMRAGTGPTRVKIREIGENYVDIALEKSGLRQNLAESDLPADQWRIDGEKGELALLDPDNGQEICRYRKGDIIQGQIYNIDPAKAQWSIRLLPPPKPDSRPASAPGYKPA
jgi:exoribonuclease R